MSEELKDEEMSIKAIYGDEVMEQIAAEPLMYALRFHPSISLRTEFPPDYPDAPPSILGTQTIGADLAKGDGAYSVELVRQVLSEVYTPGAPCIFDLIEEVRTRLQDLGLNQDGLPERPEATAAKPSNGDTGAGLLEDQMAAELLAEQPPWTISEVLAEKKSVFVARCAPVTSTGQAQRYLAHLLASDKKVAKATHNITAWRIQGDNGVQYQDCDDDGETAAGGRLLHLLELMRAWDVMVVVTRWYGGVQLGPDRFRLINQTARDALVRGGFAPETEKKDERKKSRR